MKSDERKIDIPPAQLVTLASSLALALTQKYSTADLITIRQFLSAVCSNISLYEFQSKNCGCEKDKNR